MEQGWISQRVEKHPGSRETNAKRFVGTTQGSRTVGSVVSTRSCWSSGRVTFGWWVLLAPSRFQLGEARNNTTTHISLGFGNPNLAISTVT